MKRSRPGAGGMDRRSLLACGGIGLAALAGRRAQGQALLSPGSPVETTAGKVAGLANGPVRIFKGIPYGAPTDGANRFMPPQKPVPWSGIREATQIAPRCPQPPTPGLMPEEAIDLDYGPMSEDCLSLNVWTAADAAAKRPVMVWFHGGGYAVGSGGSVRYDGSNLARKRKVVVVTVNHRLNAFGFLDLSSLGGARFADSANVGMLDVVAALAWVRDNIANFGGDPANVTVFGESGGGGKVSTLMAMPAAKGLFHRVIAQSGVALRGITLKNRVVIAPMHQYSAVKGYATDWHLMNAGRFAAGGAGLVIMESTKVERRGCGTVGDLGIWKDDFIPGLKRCAEFIRRHAAVPGIQLGHSGRKARRFRPWEDGAPLKPSTEIDDWEAWELVRDRFVCVAESNDEARGHRPE